MILTMTESYSPAVVLMRSPLKRLIVPAVIIFTLAGMAGCFAYFVVAPAPVSQSAALAASSATEVLPSTVGQVRDRLRPSDEDIVKAFRLATEDPVVAQGAVFVTEQPAIARPIPLPKRRPPPPRP
jgi:hypothetical protein